MIAFGDALNLAVFGVHSYKLNKYRLNAAGAGLFQRGDTPRDGLNNAFQTGVAARDFSNAEISLSAS